MAVSEANKRLAAYLQAAFARQCEVTRYDDSKAVNTVDILTAPGTPVEGVSAHATVCLSDQSLGLELEGAPLRVEMLLALRTDFETAATLLATCAFNVINAGYKTAPGLVHPDVMAMYAPDSAMRHILLTPAFSWPLETQSLPGKNVAWLQLLPISEAEFKFSQANGADALETMLEQCGIDPFDPRRASVL